MPNTDWEIRLVNEVSSAAKQAGVDLRSLALTVRDVKEQLEHLTVTEKKEAGTSREAKKEHENFFGDMVKAQFWVDGIEEGIRSLGDLAEEFIKSAEEAVDFDYKATVALTHMIGSAEQAEDILKAAHAFANGVGEDFDKVAVTYQKLAATGLKGDQLTAAAAAAKDLSVVSGQSFDSVSSLFEMIGSDRGLTGLAVKQLSQYPQLLQQLEKQYGVFGHSNAVRDLSKILEDAPLKGAAGLNMLENMVMKAAHENQLGDVSVEIGESFSGSATRIQNEWKQALGSIANDPAVASIRSDFSSIADYFDPANEGGKELTRTMKGLADPVADLFKFFKDNRGVIAETIGEGIGAVKFVLEGVGLFIKGIVEDIHAVQLAGAYLGALAETHSFTKAAAEVKDADDEQHVKQNQEDYAEERRGMTPQQRKEEDELNKLPAPRELPALAPLPSMDEGGSVDRTGMVTVHEGETIVPAGVTHGDTSNSTTAGGHTFHFEVHVQAGEAHQLDEQMLVAKLNELTPGAIMNALEQMNQMKGGQ